MVPNKSLDEFKLIAAILDDVHTLFEDVFDARVKKLTIRKISDRLRAEGMGFLTKSLPRLGKAFDRTLSSLEPLDAVSLGFEPKEGCKYPKLLGELFGLCLDTSGVPLQRTHPRSVQMIRQVLYLFYKYELGYSPDQESDVITQFLQTENDIASQQYKLWWVQSLLPSNLSDLPRLRFRTREIDIVEVTREARIALSNALSGLDPQDIIPRHGPGVVATKQKLWEKFRWTNVSDRITSMYPLDAFFFASLGHVCDRPEVLSGIDGEDLPAQVLLVPKDSRGPRLISCEPVDFQWVQQGLGRAIMRHVEQGPHTRFSVYFTDQRPNQIAALLGSSSGRYATLDLKEASDRVSVDLVHLLFPDWILPYLDACRSQATRLPNGDVIPLRKYAPMGSALCFPILALTTWAILDAAFRVTTWEGSQQCEPDQIHVYGDDVIVPTAFAANAITVLEAFGLLVNRSKSCTNGFFRESCGTDAYDGVDVTPVRIRTVWSSQPRPEIYTSWIAYANSFYDRCMFASYDYIVSMLLRVYNPIPWDGLYTISGKPATKPSDRICIPVPTLRECPTMQQPIRSRSNKRLQKREYLVPTVKSRIIRKTMDGWLQLLRTFTEGWSNTPTIHGSKPGTYAGDENHPFSSVSYTKRNTSMLVYRWR